eukprot:1160231-Amphidinium_carterae.2
MHKDAIVFNTHLYPLSSWTIAGLLTGYGLDHLAGKLLGPKVDRATLQLVGMLFASILLPGLARALVAQQQKFGKVACCRKLNKEGTNARMSWVPKSALVNIAIFQQQMKVD